MYVQSRTQYVRPGYLDFEQNGNNSAHMISQKDRVKQQLRKLGMSRLALMTMESRYLPHVIHSDEDLVGVVYGKTADGFAMLIATDRRIIFLDKKLLFVNEDEIKYDVVSGVSHSSVGMGSTIVLHTRIKDYTIQTINEKCADTFARAIDVRCLEQKEEQL